MNCPSPLQACATLSWSLHYCPKESEPSYFFPSHRDKTDAAVNNSRAPAAPQCQKGKTSPAPLKLQQTYQVLDDRDISIFAVILNDCDPLPVYWSPRCKTDPLSGKTSEGVRTTPTNLKQVDLLLLWKCRSYEAQQAAANSSHNINCKWQVSLTQLSSIQYKITLSAF